MKMFSCYLAWIFCCSFILGVNEAIGQNAYEWNKTGIQQLKQKLDAKANRNAPGFALLVAHKDSVVLEYYSGRANVTEQTTIGPNTLFYVGSVAKTFTAAAILKLRQDKKLNLADKLRQWLPGLPAYTNEVRIYHLLTHLSGITDYYKVLGEDLHQFYNADVLRFVQQQDSLQFEPGLDVAYSNTAYILLAAIVEKASGKKFTDYVAEQLLAPAGMHHTLAMEAPGRQIPGKAVGYRADSTGKWVIDDYRDIYTVGAGGFYSNVRDLHAWMVALKKGTVISQRSFELMTSFPITWNGRRSFMGMGFTNESMGKGSGLENLVVYGSIGGLKGFRSMIMYLPDNDIHFVVTTNNGTMGIELAEVLHAILVKK